MTVRFRLNDDVFEKLREKQRSDGRLNSVATENDAIWLHTDLGPSYYLTRDGRILSDDVIWETPVEEVADEILGASALILGARHLDAPELLALLPKRPLDATDCVRCAGSGRFKPPGETNAPDARILCWDCGGLGWVAPGRPSPARSS